MECPRRQREKGLDRTRSQLPVSTCGSLATDPSATLLRGALQVASALKRKGHTRYAHRSKRSGALGDDLKAPTTCPADPKRLPKCEIWAPAQRCFQVDCAGLVRRLLQDTNTDAYNEILGFNNEQAGQKRVTDRLFPRAATFFAFAESLSLGGYSEHWEVVESVEQLRGGDIVVWRLNAGEGHTGHASIALGGLKVAKFPMGSMEFQVLHSWTTPATGIQCACCKRHSGGDWMLPGFTSKARLRDADMRVLRLKG